jgi:hypothetical protein
MYQREATLPDGVEVELIQIQNPTSAIPGPIKIRWWIECDSRLLNLSIYMIDKMHKVYLHITMWNYSGWSAKLCEFLSGFECTVHT